MSIGNLKDSGNQGNNLPYQLKVLQGLASIAECCNGTSIDITGIANKLQDQERVPNIVRTTNAPGTIPKCYSFSIANVGLADGTYKGITIAPGEVVNFDAGVLNNGFAATIYDATGTTFLITYITSV
jgi:hypothetical protein